MKKLSNKVESILKEFAADLLNYLNKEQPTDGQSNSPVYAQPSKHLSAEHHSSAGYEDTLSAKHHSSGGNEKTQPARPPQPPLPPQPPRLARPARPARPPAPKPEGFGKGGPQDLSQSHWRLGEKKQTSLLAEYQQEEADNSHEAEVQEAKNRNTKKSPDAQHT